MTRWALLLCWLGAMTASMLAARAVSAQRQIDTLVTADQTAPVTSRFADIQRLLGCNGAGLVAVADAGGISLSDGRAAVSFGDRVPGFGRLTRFRSPAVNAGGDVVFIGGAGIRYGVVGSHPAFGVGPGLDPRKVALMVASQGQIRVVVTPGDPSPDGTPFFEATYDVANTFGEFSFNDDGWLAVPARTGLGNGLFLDADGAMEKLAVIGDPAPDGGTYTTLDAPGTYNRPVLGNGGEVVFVATTTLGTSLFAVSRGGGGRIVARLGDLLPDGAQIATFTGEPRLGALAINAGGDVALFAEDMAGHDGLYLAAGGSLRKVAAVGDPAPGGGTFRAFGLDNTAYAPRLAINDAGDVAFFAHVTGGGVGAGIHLWSNGTIRSVVSVGETALGGRFDDLGFGGESRFVLTADGTVAFSAAFTGPYPPTVGAFVARPDGALAAIARNDEPAPTRAAYRFLTMGQDGVNASGAVAFRADVGGGSLFVADATGVHPVASIRTPAPGGGTFTVLGAPPTINASGDVAFVAYVDDGSAVRSAIFAGPPDMLRRVATAGDLAGRYVLVSPGGPFIADGGQVTFVAALNVGRHAVLRADDAGLAIVGRGDIQGFGDMNDAGAFAFWSQRQRRVQLSKLVLFSGTRLRTLMRLRRSQPLPGSPTSNPAINDRGDIAFATMRQLDTPPGEPLEFEHTVTLRAADGTLTRVATATRFPDPDLNDVDDVLYADVPATGAPGLFRWRQGSTEPAVLVGDATAAGAVAFFNAWSMDHEVVAFVGGADDGDGEVHGLFTTVP